MPAPEEPKPAAPAPIAVAPQVAEPLVQTEAVADLPEPIPAAAPGVAAEEDVPPATVVPRTRPTSPVEAPIAAEVVQSILTQPVLALIDIDEEGEVPEKQPIKVSEPGTLALLLVGLLGLGCALARRRRNR